MAICWDFIKKETVRLDVQREVQHENMTAFDGIWCKYYRYGNRVIHSSWLIFLS